MLKTVVNFRWDKRKVSIDSCLTREWDATLVDAAATIGEANPAAVAVLYAGVDQELVDGMKELVRAQHGMSIRRACDSAIEGPFVLDHEMEITDKDLIAWFKTRNKQ